MCTTRAGEDAVTVPSRPGAPPTVGLAAEPARAPSLPASPLPSDAQIDWDRNAVMKVLGKIAQTMTTTEYLRGGVRVDERRGLYAFDCSGMADWVLHKAVPAAATSARGGGGRPLAADFYRRISAMPADRDLHGWRQISRVEDAEPGDVIAWIKPPIVRSLNTGHVAFVVQKPAPVASQPGTFLVRVADSTSLLHDEDTRSGRTGFGLGTIVVLADATSGAPTGYGWAGLRAWTFQTPMAIGRPVR